MSEQSKGARVSIFQKLLAAMLLVAIIPLASVWLVSRNNAIQDWTGNIDRQLAGTANSLADEGNNWVDLNRRLMEQNAQTSAIRSMDKEKQDPILRSIKNTYEWVNLAFTIDPQGNNIGRSDNRPPGGGELAQIHHVAHGNPGA